MHDMIALDGFDMKLLAALQEDASATNAELADKVGLSQSQISRRRIALEAAGVIRGYRVLLDAEALGLGLTVFIHVTLDTHSGDNARLFRALVAETANVIEAHALTGEADYLLRLQVSDLRDLSRLVNEVLLPHPAIARVRSEIVLETLKATAPLPLRPPPAR